MIPDIINAVPCYYLWYGVMYTKDSIPTKQLITLRKSMNMRASAELRAWKLFAFSHSKTAISFNILLVLLILYLRNIYIFRFTI